MSILEEIFDVEKPVIGMVHLLSLPGSPKYAGGGLQPVLERALTDAKALMEGGVDGIQFENFGDKLFVKGVRPETIAFMTAVICRVKEEVDLPHGVCVLMSGISALCVAKATGGKWIRAPYYTEVYASYVGLVEGEAAEILRKRRDIDASEIRIFADVHIKHAHPLLQRPIEDAAKDAVEMALADAVIVTGKATGSPADVEDVKRVKSILADTPVLVGSGVNVNNIDKYWEYCDGFIVGTSLKIGGLTENPVDIKRVKTFMGRVRELRSR